MHLGVRGRKILKHTHFGGPLAIGFQGSLVGFIGLAGMFSYPLRSFNKLLEDE